MAPRYLPHPISVLDRSGLPSKLCPNGLPDRGVGTLWAAVVGATAARWRHTSLIWGTAKGMGVRTGGSIEPTQAGRQEALGRRTGEKARWWHGHVTGRHSTHRLRRRRQPPGRKVGREHMRHGHVAARPTGQSRGWDHGTALLWRRHLSPPSHPVGWHLI